MKFQNSRRTGVGAVLLLSLAGAVPPLHSQEGARPPQAIEAEATAKDLFAAGDYDKAVPVLENALAANPGDLGDASLLAMAYLYSSSRLDQTSNLDRAKAAMDKVIADGGEAVFLVGRGDDPMKFAAVHMLKVIQGELRIGKDSITFVPSRSATGGVGPLTAADIKECGLNRTYGSDSAAFHLKLQKAVLNFRPLHFSRDESDLVCALAAKYLGVRTAN
jgi:tetratricopeptide (TPR) repeat protein